ncbi:MAG TPA: beta-N-acetylhexosaminidase, partial [Bacteroidetes bacterium]|nr:beta-N-acetylhexosaminidase [Bacteroidota bacterium]
VSDIPLMIALDAEWGLGMRLKDGLSFPKQLTLGAIKNNRLIYDMGVEIARELKRIGVNFSYSPVVDINNNPQNPIINDRSFGEDKRNVASKAYAYMKGLQNKNIIACAKHFPGHGFADVDSHKDLPVLDLSKERLWSTELFPFRMLVQQGVESIMTAHLHIPVIDNRKNRPTSLSSNAIKGILRDSLHYDGLVVTDALEMKGVSNYFSPADAVLEAFKAGNDIMELPIDLPSGFNAIKTAVRSGEISMDRLDASVLRILMAKFNIGLYSFENISTENVLEEVNTGEAKALKENLYRNAITFLGKTNDNLPLLPEEYSKKIAVVSIGSSKQTAFQSRFDTYFRNDHYNFSYQLSSKDLQYYSKKLKDYDKVIIGLHDYKKWSNVNFGFSPNILKLINGLKEKNGVVLTFFGTPYALKEFSNKFPIVLAYENDPMAQDMAAQSILGVFDVSGTLPVTVSDLFKVGDGNFSKKADVMGYSIPEYTGIAGDSLKIKIDRVVAEMFDSAATPGCQILVAKDGNIVYDTCFGYWTYDKKTKVKHDDIYGLASVTKVMATTISMMKLQDEKKVSVFDKFSKYKLPGIDTSNKKDILIMEAMAHHAGLTPWIPAYRKTLDTINGQIVPSKRYYRKSQDEKFSIKIAENFYLRNDFVDTLWSMLLASPLLPEKKYKYSDLGLIMTKEVVEKVAGMPEDKYVEQNFYNPMGLWHTGYNPWKRFPKSMLTPAEDDDYWRHQIVQGYVHDMWAAMLGGVSGHAGLFSNSRDLARILQMIINGGNYGNKHFFSFPTIYTFTTRYRNSTRRGIGWDMKELDKSKNCNISELASPSTFGHYGFTGTCVWADPENNIVYVFLSNRTFPTMKNRKMYKYNYRSKIQSAIYESLKNK